jgi:branched-chain amino acid aminotransferase
VIRLAHEEKIPFEEHDLDEYDAYNADEAFLTSTSLCVCAVQTINGAAIGTSKVPGPVTERLTRAYVRFVGCDFVAQYLHHLN